MYIVTLEAKKIHCTFVMYQWHRSSHFSRLSGLYSQCCQGTTAWVLLLAGCNQLRYNQQTAQICTLGLCHLVSHTAQQRAPAPVFMTLSPCVVNNLPSWQKQINMLAKVVSASHN